MRRLLLLSRACRAAAAAPTPVGLLCTPVQGGFRLHHGRWSAQLGPTALLPERAGGFCSHRLASTPRGTAQLEQALEDAPVLDTQLGSSTSSSSRGSTATIDTSGSSSPTTSSSASAVQAADAKASAADLHRALLSSGLQYSTVMAVVKVAANYALMPSRPEVLAERAKELVDYFGSPVANKILRQDPELLIRLPGSLTRNWEGICQVLQLSPEEAVMLLQRAPLLMNNRPEAVQERYRGIQQVLQVDDATLKHLVMKVPNLLRASLARLEETVPFLCSVAGVSPAQLVQAFTAWPVLGTTRLDTLQNRYATLQALLGGTPEQMQRLCRHWPNLMARDPDQLVNNLATLSQRLGIPLEDLKAMVLDEPGLLNYNVSTLTNRIHDVTLTLRLPRKLMLTLLTYNRALLTCAGKLKERLLFLQDTLGVDEEQLFQLVHKYPSILRFPPEVCNAKLATVAALSATHPAWKAQWEARTPLRTLRIMQASWATLWRAAYLRSTGQAATCSLVQAVVTKHATFSQAYPDFLPWLNRYNAHAQGPSLPATGGPLQANEGSNTKRSIYSPVIPMVMGGKMLHAGSLYRRHREQQQQQQSPPDQQGERIVAQGATGGRMQGALAVLQPSGLAAAAHLQETQQQQQQQQLQPPLEEQPDQWRAAAHPVPATQAGWLACLLGVSVQQAEDLLVANHRLRMVSWRDWHVRLKACEALLVSLGLLPEPAGGTTSSDSAQDSFSGSSSSRRSADIEDSIAGGQALATQQPVAALGHSQPATLPLAASAGRFFCADPSVQPVLAAAKAAAAAVSSRTHSHAPEAAVAAATVALNLADFSPQLSSVPMAVPPLVAQLVLANPKAFSPKKGPALTESCRMLQLLAKQHPAAREVLLEGGMPGLASLLGFSLRRVAFLEFLLQTGEPWPWPVPLKQLLIGDNITKLRHPHEQAFTEWQQRQEAAAQAMMLLPPASTGGTAQEPA